MTRRRTNRDERKGNDKIVAFMRGSGAFDRLVFLADSKGLDDAGAYMQKKTNALEMHFFVLLARQSARIAN